MIDREAILKQLEIRRDDHFIQQLIAWLGREDTHLLSNRETRVRVSEARRLWSTRLANTRTTKKPIEGAEALVEQLNKLTSQRLLEQVAFTGRENSGSIFFLGSDRSYVGAVLVDN